MIARSEQASLDRRQTEIGRSRGKNREKALGGASLACAFTWMGLLTRHGGRTDDAGRRCGLGVDARGRGGLGESADRKNRQASCEQAGGSERQEAVHRSVLSPEEGVVPG